MSIPNHNFLIGPVDTDSISACKKDMTTFTPEEKKRLIEEINLISPDFMEWEHDGSYECVIVIKAKNYILYDGNKIKIKGSALKASGKGTAEKEIIKKTIDILLFTHDIEEAKEKIITLYNQYVDEALFIESSEQILRWSSRKTISEKILSSERENEAKVRRAIEGSDYVEGDRVRVFFKPDDSLCLVEKFNGDYDRRKLLDKLYKTMLVFNTVINTKELLPNYALKKHRKILYDKYQFDF